jgi:hypothetical protein
LSRKYFLMTDRLGFSTWEQGDEALAQMLWGTPEVSAYIGGPYTTAEVHARLRDGLSENEVHTIPLSADLQIAARLLRTRLHWKDMLDPLLRCSKRF